MVVGEVVECAQHPNADKLRVTKVNVGGDRLLDIVCGAPNCRQGLREEMYRAYSTRASDQGPNAGKWDNSKVMEEILALRHELAQLLGFENYAFKSLATKMAENPQQVLDFLTDLAKRARPQGEKELAQLRAFAKAEFGVDELQPWDIAYYSEKQKQHLYSISDEQLRPYFPENKAVNGLFEVVKRIYGITAKERKDVDVWHPDVRFFELYDENNELRGSFYLDLYARENKRGGAWMDEDRKSTRLNSSHSSPSRMPSSA